MSLVFVVSKNNTPLMPTTSSRARKWVKAGKATPFFKSGVFCIRLNFDANTKTQSIAVGIDPGSKKEAMTVKSEKHTYLNLQIDAVDWVKDNLDSRRNLRRGRRYRKTPYRPARFNNRGNSFRKDRIPPSTKARYDLKLNIVKNLLSIVPISYICVEDIKAKTKTGKRNWNVSFSPLEVGKKYFHNQLNKIAPTHIVQGYQTAWLRNFLELEKSENKMSDSFDAHCVDSWCLATKMVGCSSIPENKKIIYLSPIKRVKAGKRRSLHTQNPEKNNIRSRQGGTRSLGFTRGSIVKYIGETNKTLLKSNPSLLFVVGGYDKNKLTLCSIDGGGKDNGRVSRNINPKDVKLLRYNRFRIRK